MARQLSTVRERIAWSYANLCRAHAALGRGQMSYTRVDDAIRYRFFVGFTYDTMKMGTLFAEEKVKRDMPRVCAYCGCKEGLAQDHLFPKALGGEDKGDNAVLACRTCNSSKGTKDMVAWMKEQGRFPPLLLLRRYLKLVSEYCERHELMDLSLAQANRKHPPFDLNSLPFEDDFPDLEKLVLWVKPKRSRPGTPSTKGLLAKVDARIATLRKDQRADARRLKLHVARRTR